MKDENCHVKCAIYSSKSVIFPSVTKVVRTSTTPLGVFETRDRVSLKIRVTCAYPLVEFCSFSFVTNQTRTISQHQSTTNIPK